MEVDYPSAARLAELAETLHTAATPAQTAEQITTLAREQCEADYASITLIRRGGRLDTVAPTDPVTVTVDRLQYDLDEGICRDSTWQGLTLESQRLASDPRWPRWGPKAAELGIASMVAAELTGETGRRIGSVNLFWATEQTFTPEAVAYARLFARHAAVALAYSLTMEGLNAALDSRNRIGQALGILMARYDLDERRAFDVLRRYSQDHNVKLREVAEKVVTHRALPAPADAA